jgi:hypothetical protein
MSEEEVVVDAPTDKEDEGENEGKEEATDLSNR